VGRDELLKAEMQAYHAPGTCTFYGTANSNQMLLEAMGLHVPGTAFVNPGAALREELTREAVRTVLGHGTAISGGQQVPAACAPIGHVVDERCIVNAMVALLATGGSTNHLIHWVAVARAAGIVIDWDDFSALSDVVPLLARVYPNGSADVNHFQAAGGPGFVIRELLDAGPPACRGSDRARRWPARVHPGTAGGCQWCHGLARRRPVGRHDGGAAGHRTLQCQRRPEAAARQPGSQRDQGVRGAGRPPCGAGAGPHLRLAGGAAGRVQGR
jgi:hypothetical protein